MTPWEFLPEFLFEDKGLAYIYVYCLSKLRPKTGKILFKDEIVALKSTEAFILKNPLDQKLGISDEEFLKKLSILEEKRRQGCRDFPTPKKKA